MKPELELPAVYMGFNPYSFVMPEKDPIPNGVRILFPAFELRVLDLTSSMNRFGFLGDYFYGGTDHWATAKLQWSEPLTRQQLSELLSKPGMAEEFEKFYLAMKDQILQAFRQGQPVHDR